MFKNIIFLFVFSLVFNGCFNSSKPIKIAIVTGLSGKYSNLGSEVRDGVVLAFNEINYNINGKKIELIQKDDKQDVDTDKQVIKTLIKDNIEVIIGNTTSSMTKVSLDILKKHQNILLFSPTASSSEFSNKDDNFLRTNGGDARVMLDELIRFIREQKFQNITVIGDEKNKTFLKTYTKILPQYLKAEKLIKNNISTISSNLSLENILSKLKSLNSDMILVVANSTDSAKIIQYLRFNHILKPIVCSGWAKDQEFFEDVGKYAKGIYFVSSIEKQESSHCFEKFKTNFIKMYHKQPGKFNIKGYKAAQIIIEALKINNNPEQLKQTILMKKSFDTINGKVIFNKYGDIQYKEYLLKIDDNNHFKRVYHE